MIESGAAVASLQPNLNIITDRVVISAYAFILTSVAVVFFAGFFVVVFFFLTTMDTQDTLCTIAHYSLYTWTHFYVYISKNKNTLGPPSSYQVTLRNSYTEMLYRETMLYVYFSQFKRLHL